MTIDASYAERVREAVAERRDEMIHLLIDFCAIPAENPPGSSLVESQAWIERTLAGYGIPFESHRTSRSGDAHRVIIGSIGDSGPVIYLHGHYDVVPAFSADQFSPTVRDGAVYGRGASDMKSGLVAMLIGALVHRDLGGLGRIRLVYVPDEETGGKHGSERMVELKITPEAAPQRPTAPARSPRCTHPPNMSRSTTSSRPLPSTPSRSDSSWVPRPDSETAAAR